MKRDRYRVVLEIDVVGDEFLPPHKWNWPELLDMPFDQVCRVETTFLGSGTQPDEESDRNEAVSAAD